MYNILIGIEIINYSDMLKKYLLITFNLAIIATSSSCRKDENPVTPPIIDNKKDIQILFNNAYRGLLSENEAIGKKDPGNPDKKFLAMLKEAKKTIDGAFYDIENVDYAKGFAEAVKRGVKVRLVTDTSNLKKSGEIKESIKILNEAKIEIKEDKRSASMHHKFMIVDNKYVLTGSTNLTTSSIYYHNNDTLIINSEKLSANYQAEFNRLFEKNLFAPNPHEIPNPEVTLTDGTVIKTFFSPQGKTEAAILKEINGAKKSIRFMQFSFTSKPIADAMINKCKQKMSCEGVYDTCQINKYSTFSMLKNNKITLYKDGNQALMHEKVIIIDDNIVITGSYNLSNNAEHNNNENTLIIKSNNIAKIYNDEYERLKTASINNKNLPSYDHPACKPDATPDPV
jgi:phosphatidylserine/phosphatidylglycerophosphate/cardiolipin synthase-like enzyme